MLSVSSSQLPQSIPQEQFAGGGKRDSQAHASEITRRDALLRESTSSLAVPAFMTISSRREDFKQKTLVFNLSHRGQSPKQDRPSVRILGAFDTVSNPHSIQKYITEAFPILNVNFWTSPFEKWILICKTLERQNDSEYALRKIDLLKELHRQDRIRRDQDFQKNREEKKTGEVDLSLDKQRLVKAQKKKNKISSRLKALAKKRECQKKNSLLTESSNSGVSNSGTSAVASVGSAVGSVGSAVGSVGSAVASGTSANVASEVPAILVQRKQEFAVISVMRDITKKAVAKEDDPEPAFIVWGIFGDNEEAQKFIDEDISRQVYTCDLEIVDLYEFLHLEDVDRDKIPEGYRHPEQNKVMLQRKVERQKVLDYKQFCEARGTNVNVVDVDPVLNPSNLLPLEQTITASIKQPPQLFTVDYDATQAKVEDTSFHFGSKPTVTDTPEEKKE